MKQITINEFLAEYGIKKKALERFGLSLALIKKYGDDRDLKPKYRTMLDAALRFYGYYHE